MITKTQILVHLNSQMCFKLIPTIFIKFLLIHKINLDSNIEISNYLS